MGLITEYKCPGCGAPLAFDADIGKVRCDHCGSEYSVMEVVDAHSEAPATQQFNWGDYKHGLSGEHMEDLVVYKCRSCGAEIETDANTAATTCPYCDSNVVMTDRVSGGLRPNCIIPFKKSKKDIPELMRRFYGDKSLLPGNFLTESQMEKAQGVYVPFWLFDCTVSGDISFNAQRSISMPQGRDLVTRTSHYLVRRGGTIQFSNVPVDASTKMDDSIMDSIEPYDYSELVPFEEAYLTGFVADRFDSDPDAELHRADERTLNSAIARAERTVMGYDMVSLRNNNLSMQDASVKYALLPVYVLNCQYNGKNYRYAINGQTGKVVGELPIDKGKLAGRFFKGFAAAAVIVGAIAAFIMGF